MDEHPEAGVEAVLRATVELVRHGAALGAQFAEHAGLHPTDAKALQVLDLAAEGGGITMSGLAQALALTPQAVTALVTRLEARHLARREPDPDDRRRTRVVLAPAAREFGASHLAPLAAQIRRTAGALSPGERAVVAEFLAGVLAPDPAAP